VRATQAEEDAAARIREEHWVLPPQPSGLPRLRSLAHLVRPSPSGAPHACLYCTMQCCIPGTHYIAL